MDELFKLHKLKPGEVQIEVVAKTQQDKALARLINKKANEYLEKLVRYAEMMKNDTK